LLTIADSGTKLMFNEMPSVPLDNTLSFCRRTSSRRHGVSISHRVRTHDGTQSHTASYSTRANGRAHHIHHHISRHYTQHRAYNPHTPNLNGPEKKHQFFKFKIGCLNPGVLFFLFSERGVSGELHLLRQHVLEQLTTSAA